jgi:hypothetical protein
MMAYQFNWGQANDKRPSVLSQVREPTKPAVTLEIGKKTCGSPHGPTSSSSKSQTGARASNNLKSKLLYDRPIGPLSDEKGPALSELMKNVSLAAVENSPVPTVRQLKTVPQSPNEGEFALFFNIVVTIPRLLGASRVCLIPKTYLAIIKQDMNIGSR